ncbi:MAG: DUF2141 domain-containing protein [Planctomycetota bacterium]
MFEGLKDTWSRNHGSLLFGCAVAVSLVGCGLRYFNLLPDIELQPPQVLGEEVPSPAVQPIELIVTVIAPKELPGGTCEGFLEMHVASGTFVKPADRVSVHPFEIEANGITTVVVDHLPQGEYTPIVYLDLNGNGALDFEKDLPSEPVRTTQSTSSTPSDLSMNGNSLELHSGRLKSIFMQF